MPDTRMKKKIKLRERERDRDTETERGGRERERERGKTDLKRGSLNWILGKELGIYYRTCFLSPPPPFL